MFYVGLSTADSENMLFTSGEQRLCTYGTGGYLHAWACLGTRAKLQGELWCSAVPCVQLTGEC